MWKEGLLVNLLTYILLPHTPRVGACAGATTLLGVGILALVRGGAGAGSCLPLRVGHREGGVRLYCLFTGLLLAC